MPSRREALITGAIALAGCNRITSSLARVMSDHDLRLSFPPRAQISAARHLTNRASFGPAPGDEERIESIGAREWIEAQLAPESIDDAACDLRTMFIDALAMPSDLLFELRPEEIHAQLVEFGVLRAIHSQRQLYEVLVEAWLDHFHVAITKAECRHLEVVHVQTIRAHAMGRFRDLLRATAISPAMLVYLDGRENAVRENSDVPNENYARELLELHTLGVHGGYTQRDVMEAARALTGWVVREDGAPGSVYFDPARHDRGAKTVLGARVTDLDSLLDVIVAHPSCAVHVAGTLCRTFVSAPSDALIVRSAAIFRTSDGDIPTTVRSILLSDEFARDRSTKIKRPLRFVVSAMRAMRAEMDEPLVDHLRAMGHAPFEHPTPDGYPRDGEAYLATLLARWRFAIALAPKIDRDVHAAIDGHVVRHFVGRDPEDEERCIASSDDPIALAIASPAFQRY